MVTGTRQKHFLLWTFPIFLHRYWCNKANTKTATAQQETKDMRNSNLFKKQGFFNSHLRK